MIKSKNLTSIKKNALKLLKDTGLNPETIDLNNNLAVDINKIADCLDIKIKYHSFSKKISGIFYNKNNTLYIGVNKEHSSERQRFTIAHEIGHYILHSDEIFHYDDMGEIDDLHFRADNILSPQETEANYFAAELLMPEILIDRCIENGMDSIIQLANSFQVSEQAMRYRLINIGYL